MIARIFIWWTGDRDSKSWGVSYGSYAWPSHSEWFVPGTWPIACERSGGNAEGRAND